MLIRRKIDSINKIPILLLGILFLLCFGYFDGHTSENGTRQFGQLAVLSSGVLCFLFLILKLKLRRLFLINNVLLLFLVWLLILVPLQKNINLSIKNFSNIIFSQVFMFFSVNILWRYSLNTLTKYFILYIHFVLFISIYVHITKVGYIVYGSHNPADRFGGIFFYGVTGAFAGLGCILSTYRAIYYENFKGSVFYIFSAGVFAIYVLLTDMRTILLAILPSIVIQIYFKRLESKKSVLILLISPILFYFLFTLYSSHNVAGTQTTNDFVYRNLIWKLAIEEILKQPLVGYGGYYDLLSKSSLNNIHVDSLHDPHSSYLGLILQSGTIALILMIYICTCIIKYVIRQRVNKGVLSFILFWLICGISGGSFFLFTFNIEGLLFELTIFGILLHPDIRIQTPFSIHQIKSRY